MFRFIISMLLYVSVARWMYAEIQLVAPSVTPSIDNLVNYLTIPTHDKWDKEAIASIVSNISNATNAEALEK